MKKFDFDIRRLEDFLHFSATDGETKTACPYSLRFKALESRARLTILEERSRMVDALKAFRKPYHHTTMLVEGMQYMTIAEAKQQLAQSQSVIALCETHYFKRLECEVRLVQLYFHVVLRNAGIGSDLAVDSSFRRIASLCRTFPDTAGQFWDAYSRLWEVFKETRPHGNLYKASQRSIWWSWPCHKTGYLEHCAHGHPYSSKTWAGCPECGLEVVVGKALKTLGTNVRLKETEFVAAIHRHTFDQTAWRK